MAVEAARAGDTVVIDADGLHYRELNERIHRAAAEGARLIEVRNVNGQRYIGAGLRQPVTIRVHGTAGNDLGVFMDGPTIEVFGNAQDGAGNTMNGGRIVVHGDAGQIVGLSMRCGRIYVRGSVGYRSGIHMKGYEDRVPVIVIGGRAGAFLGEYMAGGRLYVLGLAPVPACAPGGGDGDAVSGAAPLDRAASAPLAAVGARLRAPAPADGLAARLPARCRSLVGFYTGTGMHGGVIYVRGQVDPHLVGKEVVMGPADEGDLEIIRADLADYAACFGLDAEEILAAGFTRLAPKSHRPYGKNYAY